MGVITLKQHPKLQPTSSPITWVSIIFSTPTLAIGVIVARTSS